MDHRLLELLVCPICKAPLDLWRASGPDGVDELFCRADRLAYPIRDGIPVMLENEARTTDAPETGSAP